MKIVKREKEARLICDVYKPDGTPFEGCPRNVLKNILKEAEEMGYTLNVEPECEFFLFSTDDKGNPSLETHDDAGYFDLAPIDLGGNARKDMTITLKEMGFDIEASHHEVAPGQHEIDFKYKNALTTADNIITFKMDEGSSGTSCLWKIHWTGKLQMERIFKIRFTVGTW